MVKFKNLKPGQCLSETQYYKVVKTSGDKVQLQNDRGENIVVDKAYVENCLNSADQYVETKKVTRTELASIFSSATNTAMTVNFNLKPKVEEVVTKIEGLSSKKFNPREVISIVKNGFNGEERTMIGRHYGSVNEFGRVSFVDMEEKKDEKKAYDTRTRQVDPRTINWLICNGVKYEVK